MPDDTLHDLAEEYALGSLGDDDRQRFERHLATCPACAATIRETDEALAGLPLALTVAAPRDLPADLKGRLLERLNTGPAESASSPDRLPIAPVRSQPAPGAARPNGRSARRWVWVGALAAALVLAVLAGWTLQLSNALAQERALRAEYASLVDQQEIVLEVVDSPGTVKRILRPPGGDSRAYGKLYTRPDLNHVVVMAARLAQPEPGQVYRLWLTANGTTASPGVLAVNDEGFGLLVFDAESTGPTYDAAFLTLQAEDLTVPSTPPVLAWDAATDNR